MIVNNYTALVHRLSYAQRRENIALTISNYSQTSFEYGSSQYLTLVFIRQSFIDYGIFRTRYGLFISLFKSTDCQTIDRMLI